MKRNLLLTVICVLFMLFISACGQEISSSSEVPEVASSEDTVSEPSDEPATSMANDIEPDETSSIAGNTGEVANDEIAQGYLEINFMFNRAGTIASNQYAIWIEDMDGNLVKTIFVTNYTANGGYVVREESLPHWVAVANPASSENIDAVSGATPSTGNQTFTWNGEDDAGILVEPGQYIIRVEGTLFWSSTAIFSGQFHWGAVDNNEIEMSLEYTEELDENADMIVDVSVSYNIMK